MQTPEYQSVSETAILSASTAVLQDMGYAACIDAQIVLLASLHSARAALEEVRDTGSYTGMDFDDMVAARQSVEDLIGLDAFYEIEEQTVEERKWGKR